MYRCFQLVSVDEKQQGSQRDASGEAGFFHPTAMLSEMARRVADGVCL